MPSDEGKDNRARLIAQAAQVLIGATQVGAMAVFAWLAKVRYNKKRVCALGDMSKEALERMTNLYLQKVPPALIAHGYHLRFGKGRASEQSDLVRVVNGALGLFHLAVILRAIGAPIDINTLGWAAFIYTVKFNELESIDFKQILSSIDELINNYTCLGLREFADEIILQLSRASDEDARRVELLVRIADAAASARNPAEAATTLGCHLRELIPQFADKYALHYHQLKDMRAALGNALHRALEDELARRHGFHPWLLFADGTLYVGPSDVRDDVGDLICAVTDQIVGLLAEGGDADDIRDGLRSVRYDFEHYVFAFASPEQVLEVVAHDALAAKPDHEFARKEVEKIVAIGREKSLTSPEAVEAHLGIRIVDGEEHRAFNERWFAAYRYLLYADSVLRILAQMDDSEQRLDWFVRTFAIPERYAQPLRQDIAVWSAGSIPKYVLVVAYHFLVGADFADQAAEALPGEEVLKRLHDKMMSAIKSLDLETGREAIIARMGIRDDMASYLGEALFLSFAPRTTLSEDGAYEFVAEKRKGHTKPFCSLCNRASRHSTGVRTRILEDYGRVFSNRVLAARYASPENRQWCPVCHMEFVLRKRRGVGLPIGADYKVSRRVYLYIMPAHAFTPLHMRLFDAPLEPLRQATNMLVRDYGGERGLPHLWLAHRRFDATWLDELRSVLVREAAKIAERGGRKFVGERLVLAEADERPHYYFAAWQKAARRGGPEVGGENNRIATRVEAWAKVLFAAAVIHGMTGCKVCITERFYIPPPDLEPTIVLDGPPPSLRVLLGGRDALRLGEQGRGERSGLERLLDLIAAFWVLTINLLPSKDKYVSARIKRFNIDPLAGAFFYRQYDRERDNTSPRSLVGVACQLILQEKGDEWMSIVEQIARKSLEIALPIGAIGRGKAHRYELLFRETVAAMRKAQQVIPELREATLRAQRPSDQVVAELKVLTVGAVLKMLRRRQDNQRWGVFVRAWGEDLNRLVKEFVDLVVDELYLKRAKGDLAAFLQLENQVANGVYYYTDINLDDLWNEYKRKKEESKLDSGAE